MQEIEWSVILQVMVFMHAVASPSRYTLLMIYLHLQYAFQCQNHFCQYIWVFLFIPYSVEYDPLVVACSGLTGKEKQDLKKKVSQLGGHFVSEWTKECTLLVMREINVTAKVTLLTNFDDHFFRISCNFCLVFSSLSGESQSLTIACDGVDGWVLVIFTLEKIIHNISG